MSMGIVEISLDMTSIYYRGLITRGATRLIIMQGIEKLMAKETT